jgi:hypothetical protein
MEVVFVGKRNDCGTLLEKNLGARKHDKKGNVMTIREARKRLIRAMDALIKDGNQQLDVQPPRGEYSPHIKSYLAGLTTAKKAIIKVMDNLEN